MGFGRTIGETQNASRVMIQYEDGTQIGTEKSIARMHGLLTTGMVFIVIVLMLLSFVCGMSVGTYITEKEMNDVSTAPVKIQIWDESKEAWVHYTNE